ncbi:MAG: cytochrome c biogenesis heme-transporting ATPase CcmA [Betaproteobacteria bacterium]|nr:cytochrome c biogenesis heme-transporting ATPase CcmA [Betaproteobacteria bacterium]
MLEVSDLGCVRGERTLFGGLEFTLEPGTLLRVAGRNGSGKTSLLRILCGLALPARGEVRWRGEPIRALREEFHRQLVYIGHAPAVKDDLTARENLEIACALGGAPVDGGTAASALDRVGLREHAGLPARFLSQGQRRRVSLARLAAAGDSRLWILDEPFTALDTIAIGVVQEMIAGHLDAGGAVIFTSHQEVAVATVSVFTIELGG